MNVTRALLVCITLLLAGGCATVEHVATTATEPALDNQPPQSKSLHILHAPHQQAATSEEAAVIDTGVAGTIEKPAAFWDQVRDGLRLPDTTQSQVRIRTAEYGSKPHQVERIFARGQPYLAYILSEVQKRNFPTEIVLLPYVESGYDPFAFSYGRAAGMWQFIPATGKMYGCLLYTSDAADECVKV